MSLFLLRVIALTLIIILATKFKLWEKVSALVDKIRFCNIIVNPFDEFVAALQEFPNFLMASFNQPKGRIRGNSERTRGNGNRPLGRGKGGRGGRGGQGGRLGRHGRRRGDKKTSFNSTRVDEEHRSDSDQSEEASDGDAELEFGSDGLSSDEEDGTAATSAIKPYSALLQSLNNSIQRGEPQRKKRRKIEFGVSGKIDAVKGVDLVIEPEEAEDLGIGELTDDDGNDEAEGGMLRRYFLEDLAYNFRP